MTLRRRLAALCLALALWPGAAPAQVVDLSQLTAAAEAGQADAQFALAEIYRLGEGVPQSYARAAEWYGKAADQDHAGALNALAGLHAGGLGVARDPARAFDLVSRAAESGRPEYLHTLATLLENGTGTAPDPARAAELYAQAAEQGLAVSAVALALLYQDGKGVEQDVGRALELYMGPAEAGNAQAQNNLGLIYSRGEGGVEQAYETAVSWFRKAADQGLPAAIRNLGVMYENGFGVEQDEAEAARLYRLAALAPGETADDEGDAAGVTLLYDARLLPPDAAQMTSYATAARAGDPVAMFILGYLRAASAQSGADHRTAAELFRRAADAGSSAAMANLGIMMFQGRGVLQDYVEGYKWLSLAATSGLPGAAEARDELAARMTPDQINAANTLAEAEWAKRSAAD